jgi:putative OPT family oligopeptide transporter
MAQAVGDFVPSRGGKAKTSTYREITVGAVVGGVMLGAVMTAAFTYISLKLGFGLAGSTIAAILGFALLRGVGRKIGVKGGGSIVETNVFQTVASGVNTASAGVVFTFPALLLLGEDYSLPVVMLAALAGSFMGIVIIIPLRKQLIEVERLKFPSGVAVATILKTPGAGISKGMFLGVGFLIGAAITLAINERFGLLPEEIPVGEWLAGKFGVASNSGMGFALMGTAVYMSMASFGAGLLSGKGGLVFAIGGMLAWWVIGPFAVAQGWAPAGLDGGKLVGNVYSTMLRPAGIGILIGGAIGGVFAAFPAVRGAIRSLGQAAKLAKTSGGKSEELSPRVLSGGMIASVIALFAVTIVASTVQGDSAFGTAVAAAVVGVLWIGIAGLIVAQATGATDISPLSGLALIAVTLMLAITAGNIALAVTIGVAVCIATNQCADMMSDLKTGHLIGGIPRKQQIVQFCVAWVGPAIAIGTVLLLWKGGPGGTMGFGPESAACTSGSGGCLSAPQADVLRGMITGVLDGNAPVDKYAAGGAVGLGLTMFPIGGLGVLIGLAMYLPFSITFTYGLGTMASMAIEKIKGHRYVADVIIPIAAGLIVGEALTALGMTMVTLAGGGAG